MAVQTWERAHEGDFMECKVTLGGETYEGYFSSIRIDRKSVPEGWNLYDIRHCDDDWGSVCSIKNGYVMVNHFGTFSLEGRTLPIAKDEEICLEDEQIVIGQEWTGDDSNGK